MPRSKFHGLLILALLGAPAFTVGSEPAAPDAKKTLRKVAKNFGKVKSFEVSGRVVGGLSKKEDHDVTHITLWHDYTGRVDRRVMFMPKENAYRTMEKGAIEHHDQWRQLHAVRHGKRIAMLFPFPQKLLRDSLDHPQKIEWVHVVDEPESAAPGNKDERKPEEKEQRTKGRTVVVWDGKRSDLPHVIRVTMPKTQSVERFAEVVSSGCFSGG